MAEIAKASIDDLIKNGWEIRSKHSAESLAARYGVHWLGKYNDPPENFKEVTEEEFAQGNYDDYMTVASSFRQLYFNGGLLNINLNVTPFGVGWGYSKRYYEKKVRWFTFKACEHEWETVRTGRCYRENVCKKCGLEHAIDSSD